MLHPISPPPAGERLPRRGRHDPHALLRADEKVNRDDSPLRLRHTQLAGTSHRKTRKGRPSRPFFLLEYLPWAVPHLKNNRYPFRSNIKKLLKCAIDKRLF